MNLSQSTQIVISCLLSRIEREEKWNYSILIEIEAIYNIAKSKKGFNHLILNRLVRWLASNPPKEVHTTPEIQYYNRLKAKMSKGVNSNG